MVEWEVDDDWDAIRAYVGAGVGAGEEACFDVWADVSVETRGGRKVDEYILYSGKWMGMEDIMNEYEHLLRVFRHAVMGGRQMLVTQIIVRRSKVLV